VNKGFQENLREYSKTTSNTSNYVMKLMIHENFRQDVLKDLHFMNVSRASLFVGLDGFAQSLGHKIEVEYEKDQLERLLKNPAFPN
jgi:hypothetical protein